MKKALVVVDMQNDFVTGVLGTKEAQAIVKPMAEYIKNFDGDIYATQDTHTDTYKFTQEGQKLPVPHCIFATEGWNIVPEITEVMEDVCLFNKSTFGSVELAKHIQDYHYDEVQFCGVCTGICVISNVLLTKAYCPEVPIKVIENLCACVTPESHKTAIEAMKMCQVDII